MTLGDFLAEQATRRGDFGTHDCCTVGADWVVANGHPDPMADLRGTYSGMWGATRVIAAAGDLVAAVAPGLDGAGLPRGNPDEPCTGDVAVIRRGTELPVVAIYTGERWAVTLAAGGVGLYPDAEILAIWTVPHG